MARLLSNRKFTDALTGLALLLAVLSLLCYPSEAVDAAKGGLELCCNVIVPSLFPFFVLSSLCVELGLLRYLGKLTERFMQPLFHVSGTCASAFLLGIIGGYPVGARTAIALYEKRYCTRSEAERLLSFCNNSGPAFILGVVGAGIFSSSAAGLLLYAVHVISSVLVGICFRGHTAVREPGMVVRRTAAPIETVRFADAFTRCVRESFLSTLSICAFVIFFTVVIRMLFLTGIFTAAAALIGTLLSPIGFTAEWAKKLLIGAIELSSGVWSLKDAAGSMSARLSMAAFLLGWAGVSVHCQVLSFIGQSGLSTRTYFFGKLLHGVLSASIIWLAARFLPLPLPVASCYAEQIRGLASLDFSTALQMSTAAALLVWLIVIAISVTIVGKAYRNRRRQRV